MRIVYDPRLVEEVVHFHARGDRRRWREYRRGIDPAYDAADRERALDEVCLELFTRWELDAPCAEALGLVSGVGRALVCRSRRPGDEGADLLVGEDRTVMVRVASERFANAAALRCLLRHEIRHVTDMLDPAFGYRPDLGVAGRTRAELDLVRSRYRVLWDLAIDAVEPAPLPPDERRAQIDAAFASLEEHHRDRLAVCFRDPAGRTHGNLVAAAQDPWTFLRSPRAEGPRPGQPCPLCGFPTYDWATEPPVDAILGDFPDWDPAAGACRQCADIYRCAPRA